MKISNNKTQILQVNFPFVESSHLITYHQTLSIFRVCVKNLGVIFNNTLFFENHIKNVSLSSIYFLPNLSPFRAHYSRASFENYLSMHLLFLVLITATLGLPADQPPNRPTNFRSSKNTLSRLLYRCPNLPKFCVIFTGFLLNLSLTLKSF